MAPCNVSGVGGKIDSARLFSPASNGRAVRKSKGSVGSMKRRIILAPFVPGIPSPVTSPGLQQGHTACPLHAVQSTAPVLFSVVVFCLRPSALQGRPVVAIIRVPCHPIYPLYSSAVVAARA